MINQKDYNPLKEARLLMPLINRILDSQADRRSLLQESKEFKVPFDLPETCPDSIFPLFTVKETKGVILGYLSAEVPDPVSNSNFLWIRQMSVRQGYEGRGTGVVLLNQAKDYMNSARFDGALVWAHEPRAKRFYLREGFKFVKGIAADRIGNSLFRLE